MSRWQAIIERGVIPVWGCLLATAVADGWPVPVAFYPVIAGMIGFPALRALDRIRQNGGGK